MARGFARLQVAQYVDCLADSDSDVHLRNGQYSDCSVVDGKRFDTWRGVGFADGGSGCQQRINVGNWQSFRQTDIVAVHPFHFGLAIDYLLPAEWFAVASSIADEHCEHGLSVMDWIWMGAFVLLLINAFARTIGKEHCCEHD